MLKIIPYIWNDEGHQTTDNSFFMEKKDSEGDITPSWKVTNLKIRSQLFYFPRCQSFVHLVFSFIKVWNMIPKKAIKKKQMVIGIYFGSIS